jgi:O-6-methylguanine DNA methyltransferase
MPDLKSIAIAYTQISLEPIGPIYVGYTSTGICFLTVASGTEAEFASQVARRYGCAVIRDDRRQAEWQAALKRWLIGEQPDVPIDLSRVTPFERQVLEHTVQIDRGDVRPYQWLARAVGKPGASQAIGNVMARNPVPLLIPCHRVVATSGVIGNYSMGGPIVKRQLLELEGVDVDRLHALAVQGIRFKASKTTGTYCYPTCTQIQPEDEGFFKTAQAAEAAGMRPCKICRPG